MLHDDLKYIMKWPMKIGEKSDFFSQVTEKESLKQTEMDVDETALCHIYYKYDGCLQPNTLLSNNTHV